MLNATNFVRWLFVGVGSKPTVTGEERRAGLLIIESGWTDPRGERTACTEGKIRIRTREPRMRKINPREMRYQREEERDCPAGDDNSSWLKPSIPRNHPDDRQCTRPPCLRISR